MTVRYPAENILIKCPNWVGDLVAATGALRCIRGSYPDAGICLLLKPSLTPVVADAPWFDSVIAYERHESSARDRRGAMRFVRDRRFDLAALFTHGLSSRYFIRRAGIPRRVGLASRSGALFLTDRVDLSRLRDADGYAPKVEAYRALCEKLGCENAGDQRPELFFSAEQRDRAEELLARGHAAGRPLVGLVPGAAYGPSKRWPAERFAAVADRLVDERGVDVVIFTAPDEEPIADRVQQAMRSRPIRFAPGETDLGLLKALVARCALLVCNDTGPRHYAVALGVPTVTIMGPTHPRVTESPYETGVILRRELPCAPCYRRRCPRGHECMIAIAAEQVFEAAAPLL